MPYRRPAILEMNTGTQARKMATAPLLALDTLAFDEDGRIGSSRATDSSDAKVSDITRRNSSAFFRPMTVRKELIATRINTRSAEGGGRSSAVDAGGSELGASDVLGIVHAWRCRADNIGQTTSQHPSFANYKVKIEAYQILTLRPADAPNCAYPQIGEAA